MIANDIQSVRAVTTDNSERGWTVNTIMENGKEEQ